MPYTEKRKSEIMRSRKKHKANFNEYQRKYMNQRHHNSWNYISKIFLKILIKEHEQLQE